MNVSMRIATAGKETGSLLKELLTERGVYADDGPAVVSYGIHLTDRPDEHILNGVCSRGKVFNMRAMRAANVSTVPFFVAADGVPNGFQFPAFARKSHGYGGKDLMPVFQPNEVAWRVLAGWDWFSSYVPFITEYRVWIFRGVFLDAYEKVMDRPKDYTQIGRNFGNGFEFKPCTDTIHPLCVREAARAVRALDLDFAAVDLLLGTDEKPYILEANTAPGVLRSKSEPTLHKLADCITEWAQGLN